MLGESVMVDIKKLAVVFFSITFLLSLHAEQKTNSVDVCAKTWSESDAKDVDFYNLAKVHCRLDDPESTKAVEVLRIDGACERFEGAEKTDCFFVRECRGDYENSAMGVPVYNQEQFVQALCRQGVDSRFDLLLGGNLGDINMGAYIECDSKGNHGMIHLSVGKETSVCDFPFKD